MSWKTRFRCGAAVPAARAGGTPAPQCGRAWEPKARIVAVLALLGLAGPWCSTLAAEGLAAEDSGDVLMKAMRDGLARSAP